MAPAAIIAFVPIVIPGSMVAFAPTEQPFFIKVIGYFAKDFLLLGYLSFVNVALGPMNTSSSTLVPSHKKTPHLTVTLSPMTTSFSMNV